ncbi:bath-40 [Symbiodinium necroappetens]|uniref:Bath-40 protein n=1 Tax=Symbiodinium necroappetens TaxID=1628268 RepID=A0A812LHU1_9DINO|nr:bath-40 [Symbiodinium necroappetens]
MSTGSKRKREPAGIFSDKDLSATSDVWKECFGKDGNFTVIVEEPAGEASKDTEGQTAAKRTEFKVWSFLLAQWSPVFETMISSDNYSESKESQVVIEDFSANAVETFLRFLYCGIVAGSAGGLVEVSALADKYQVKALHALCMPLIREALTPVTACEILASAQRFHMDDLRTEALDVILAEPREALQKRPPLRPELLEEILGSGLLCTEAEALRNIVRSWEGKDCDSLASIINIQHKNERTEDVLGTLWSHYKNDKKKSVFLGYWVSVVLGPEKGRSTTTDQLQQVASNQIKYRVTTGWLQWQLPHVWVLLQGFSFGSTIPASTAFRIHVKSDEDGATWHLAYESHEMQIEAETFLACKRPPSLVNYFKLEVLKGELPRGFFKIHGIMQMAQGEWAEGHALSLQSQENVLRIVAPDFGTCNQL